MGCFLVSAGAGKSCIVACGFFLSRASSPGFVRCEVSFLVPIDFDFGHLDRMVRCVWLWTDLGSRANRYREVGMERLECDR